MTSTVPEKEARMPDAALDEATTAWVGARDIDSQSPDARRRMELRRFALRLLAGGRPVSSLALAAASEAPHDEIAEFMSQARKGGAELDGDGNLVGLALSLHPTPHKFRVAGRGLFAWCSLDTMFLPGLIGQTAEIESTCPVTGANIRLTVSPDGPSDVNPVETALSIVIPGGMSGCDAVGPAGSV